MQELKQKVGLICNLSDDTVKPFNENHSFTFICLFLSSLHNKHNITNIMRIISKPVIYLGSLHAFAAFKTRIKG